MISVMENGGRLLAARWISVSVLVAILLTVVVVLLLPLLPYILRDSVTEYGNYVSEFATNIIITLPTTLVCTEIAFCTQLGIFT